MLATQICRELHFGVTAARMQSRVPRCLFGRPNPKETMELLQEALESERARFARRWGVDPLAEDEDKENGPVGSSATRHTPTKRRVSPYAKQTSIHDFWRSRKVCDPSKKSSSSTSVEGSKQQQPQPQPQQQTQPPSQPQPQSQPPSQPQPQSQPQSQPQPQPQTQAQAQTQAPEPNFVDKVQPSTN